MYLIYKISCYMKNKIKPFLIISMSFIITTIIHTMEQDDNLQYKTISNNQPTEEAAYVFTLQTLNKNTHNDKEKALASYGLKEFIQQAQQNNVPNQACIRVYAKSQQKVPTWHEVLGIKHNNTSPKEQIDTILVSKGIPKLPEDCIAIFSRGFVFSNNMKDSNPREGGGIRTVYTKIRENILPMPCVAFDYPDDKKRFDLAQELNQSYLRFIYDKTQEQNPQAKIVLMGNCVGALNILKFVNSDPKNLEAIILLSPIVSGKELIRQIARSYVEPYLGGLAHPILSSLFTFRYPNYDSKKEEEFVNVNNIRKKKILIGHVPGDKLTSDASITQLVAKLQNNNTVYFFAITPSEDASVDHSHIAQTKKFQQIAHAFFKKCDLPHNPDLAFEGRELLEDIKVLQ